MKNTHSELVQISRGACIAVLTLVCVHTSYAATTVTEGGFFVTVDLEDFFAGTLINDNANASGFNGVDNQIFSNLGDVGSSVVTNTEIGFTINGSRNAFTNGISNGGGSTESVVLYDTDRRLYYDAAVGGTATRVYDDIVRRDDASLGQALTGEDPDLEIDDQGTGEWEGGNIALTTRVGNMVVVQENITTAEANQGHLNLAQGADGGSTNNSPDDMTQGELEFNFDTDLTRYDFTWVDLDNENVVFVVFKGLKDVDGNDLEDVQISFAEFNSGGTYDQGTDWGDRHINKVVIGVDSMNTPNNTYEAFEDLTRTSGPPGTADAISFNRVVFDTGTNSGGVGQFAYRLLNPVVVIPEPSSAFSLLALITAAIYRRRFRSDID